jgi:hypothetical protein
MVLMKSLVENIFYHKTSMAKDKNMEISNCHIYQYKVTMVVA